MPPPAVLQNYSFDLGQHASAFINIPQGQHGDNGPCSFTSAFTEASNSGLFTAASKNAQGQLIQILVDISSVGSAGVYTIDFTMTGKLHLTYSKTTSFTVTLQGPSCTITMPNLDAVYTFNLPSAQSLVWISFAGQSFDSCSFSSAVAVTSGVASLPSFISERRSSDNTRVRRLRINLTKAYPIGEINFLYTITSTQSGYSDSKS